MILKQISHWNVIPCVHTSFTVLCVAPCGHVDGYESGNRFIPAIGIENVLKTMCVQTCNEHAHDHRLNCNSYKRNQ